MTRVKVFFINFLLFSTSSAKPFKASDIDSDTSHDINVTAPELNDKESITIYMKNDDILSISELSKQYNPEEHHLTDIRYIKETDNDNIKRVISKNNKTKLHIPKLEEYNKENKQDKHAETTVNNIESKESKSEKLTTETNEIESTTISISYEVLEEDLEVPESGESTEGYVDIVIFNEETSNDKLDAMEPMTPSRRSLFQNDELLLNNEKTTSNKPVEIVEVNQDTVPISGLMTVKEPDQQSIIESKTETPSVTSELPIQSDPIIAHQQSQILSPDLSFRRAMPVDLKEISNQENTNFKLEETAPEYKQNNNLDKSGDITTNNKSIEDFNSNTFENAYPYTPVKVKNINQKPLLREGNLNLLYSKLTDASEHPLRNREGVGGNNFGNSAVILPNFNLPSRRFYNFGASNFRPGLRRLLLCKKCGHNDHKAYIY